MESDRKSSLGAIASSMLVILVLFGWFAYDWPGHTGKFGLGPIYDSLLMICKDPPFAVVGGLITLGLAFYTVPVFLFDLKTARGVRTVFLRIVTGSDGLPSTSLTQFLLWSGVVFFSFAALKIRLTQDHGIYCPLDIPQNLLIATGASALTGVLAKQIAVGQSSPATTADKAAKSNPDPKFVVTDNEGSPDMNKIQVMAWTLIAITMYLVKVFTIVQYHFPVSLQHGGLHPSYSMPDIDEAMLVLTGLSYGTYLGTKLVSRAVARITGLDRSSVAVGTSVSILGAGFGQSQNGSLITIDGAPLFQQITDWSDSKVIFVVPPRHPNGSAWSFGTTSSIGLIVGGTASTNTVDLVITAT